MPVSRKAAKGMGAYAVPLMGIVLLIACYVILLQWHVLPTILGSAISAAHWPV